MSHRGKLGVRDTGGDTTRGRGTSRRKICKKMGAVSEQKRKGKRLKKKTHLAAASHLAFVSEKAQHTWNQEKVRPPCEREGVLVHL